MTCRGVTSCSTNCVQDEPEEPEDGLVRQLRFAWAFQDFGATSYVDTGDVLPTSFISSQRKSQSGGQSIHPSAYSAGANSVHHSAWSAGE